MFNSPEKRTLGSVRFFALQRVCTVLSKINSGPYAKKLVVEVGVEVGVCRLWRLCLFKTPAAKTRQMCLIPLASPRVKSPTWRGKLNGRRAPQIETNRGVCGKCEELAGIGGLVSSLFQRFFERYLCDGSTCKAARLSTFFMAALPVRGWEVWSSHMYLRRSTRVRSTSLVSEQSKRDRS